MQGGFWIVRPNMTVFDEFCDLIRNSDFVPGAGWGGRKLQYGGYYGAAQIQGLVTYYYGRYHRNEYVELNRCYYNQMADSPFFNGQCLVTGQSECQDCRNTSLTDIYSIHFTHCAKPDWCPDTEWTYYPEICYEFHRAWHAIRYDLEQARIMKRYPHNVSDVPTEGTGKFSVPEAFLTASRQNVENYYCGHCTKRPSSSFGYVPMLD